MRVSRSNKNMMLIAVLSFVCSLVLCFGAPLVSGEQKNSFDTLHEFLQAACPDLFEKGWYFDVTAFEPIDGARVEFHEFNFKITDAPPMPGNPTIDLATKERFIRQATVEMEGYFW